MQASGAAAFVRSRDVIVPAGRRLLPGTLAVPSEPLAAVAFAHGSGSSRLSPRNREVAATLQRARLATLLFDLLTDEEAADRRNVFDVPLLAGRVVAALESLRAQPETASLSLGVFGASTGAAAALWAAAERPDLVAAVVSRGGRPDLAHPRLTDVKAPTLLVVGGRDEVVLELNRAALAELPPGAALHVLPGATHLFEEPGALPAVAQLAAEWFVTHLPERR